jgi:hypothetical protein
VAGTRIFFGNDNQKNKTNADSFGTTNKGAGSGSAFKDAGMGVGINIAAGVGAE